MNKLLFISIVCLFLSSTSAAGAEWTYYGKVGGCYYYYDVSNISSSSQDNLKVWSQMVAKENQCITSSIHLREKMGLSAKDYKNYFSTIFLYEIKCSSKQFNTWKYSDYDKSGAIINIGNNTDHSWSEIIPGSMTDILRTLICRQ